MTVTLQHIADRIGVTAATVSMALRNNPRISAARRKRIQEMAKDLDYRQNAMVATLMSHIRQARRPRGRTGLLYLTTGPSAVIGPPRATPVVHFQGAQEQAARYGYNLEAFWVRQPGMTDERLEQIILSRSIPGVIIAPREDEQPFPRLPWNRLASIMISHSYEAPALDRVYPNFYNAARLAVDFLKQENCRNVRLILPMKHDRNVQHLWTAGYLQQSRGLRFFKSPLIANVPTDAMKWVRTNPDCVVLGTNQVLAWLREAGLKEYRHFRYVSLNVENDSTITGIREPSFDVGAEAVDRLIGRIQLNQTGLPESPRVTLLEPSWQQANWQPLAK